MRVTVLEAGYLRVSTLGQEPLDTTPPCIIVQGVNDMWTTVVLGTDFTTTQDVSPPANVTGWTFTPAANKSYLIEAFMLVVANSTATGIRPGATVPTGVECGMTIEVPSGASGFYVRNVWGDGTLPSAATASANLTPHFARAQGLLVAGATPGGDFHIHLATETITTTSATIKAGSFFRYREVA